MIPGQTAVIEGVYIISSIYTEKRKQKPLFYVSFLT